MVHQDSEDIHNGIPRKAIVTEKAPLAAVASLQKEVIQLVDKLRSTGVALDVELPEIVVAGDQSSGKSSAIEAISRVRLPRSPGTCTRVPMEVRLREVPDGVWNCRIHLRFETDEQGNALENISQHSFGPDITDPDLVELVLRRAQLAILNPSVPSDKFVTYDIPPDEEGQEGRQQEAPLGSTKQLAFSRNIVCMEISGPGLTDLTLIDLPGIIHSTGRNEDPRNIELVTNLVKDRISRDALILLMISAKGDIETQSAVKLARDVDPEGKRTIGVVTKIDTLRGVEKKMWLPIVRNQKEALLHGYFALRLPDADELRERLTFEEARRREDTFFAETSPWRDEPQSIRARFGTVGLTKFLSAQLMAFILRKLPVLIDQVTTMYKSVSAELRRLPSPPSTNPAGEMLNLINQMTLKVKYYTDGSQAHERLCQSLRAEWYTFRSKIQATAPSFSPFAEHDFEDFVPGPHDAEKMVKLIPTQENGPIKPVSRDTSDKGKAKSEPLLYDLDFVKLHIDKSMTRELPLSVPFACKATLIKSTTYTWEEIAIDTFASVKPVVSKLLSDLIKDIFGCFSENHLPETVKLITDEVIESLAESTQAQIRWFTRLEDTPFSINVHYLRSSKDNFMTKLRRKRQELLEPETICDDPNKLQDAVAVLAAAGFTGLSPTDLEQLRSRDGAQEALEVMAETAAYIKVAYKRVADLVPQIIDGMFIRPLSDTLRDSLLDKLNITSASGQKRCAAFLADSEVIAIQRTDLTRKLKRLSDGQEAIRDFQYGTGAKHEHAQMED